MYITRTRLPGEDKIISRLLEHGRTTINAKDDSGWTALMHACESGKNDSTFDTEYSIAYNSF
jgi:ankyrin repeat protein